MYSPIDDFLDKTIGLNELSNLPIIVGNKTDNRQLKESDFCDVSYVPFSVLGSHTFLEKDSIVTQSVIFTWCRYYMERLLPTKLSLSTVALIFVANGLAFASAVLLQNMWAMLAAIGVTALDVYLCFLRFVKKRKVRYPLVPPEGRGDMYLPRTNIPRPVVADFRRIHEKQQRFKKLNKMVRRKKRSGH